MINLCSRSVLSGGVPDQNKLFYQQRLPPSPTIRGSLFNKEVVVPRCFLPSTTFSSENSPSFTKSLRVPTDLQYRLKSTGSARPSFLDPRPEGLRNRTTLDSLWSKTLVKGVSRLCNIKRESSCAFSV